jgi:hypothetical protein
MAIGMPTQLLPERRFSRLNFCTPVQFRMAQLCASVEAAMRKEKTSSTKTNGPGGGEGRGRVSAVICSASDDPAMVAVPSGQRESRGPSHLCLLPVTGCRADFAVTHSEQTIVVPLTRQWKRGLSERVCRSRMAAANHGVLIDTLAIRNGCNFLETNDGRTF